MYAKKRIGWIAASMCFAPWCIMLEKTLLELWTKCLVSELIGHSMISLKYNHEQSVTYSISWSVNWSQRSVCVEKTKQWLDVDMPGALNKFFEMWNTPDFLREPEVSRCRPLKRNLTRWSGYVFKTCIVVWCILNLLLITDQEFVWDSIRPTLH